MNKYESPKLAFTVPEACYALGIGRSKLYALIGAGRITVFKIGKRTLIPADSLYALIPEGS